MVEEAEVKTEGEIKADAPASTTATSPAPAVQPTEPAKTPWYERRIGVLTARTKEAEEKAERLERQLALQQPQAKPVEGDATAALPPAEINRRIASEAERIAQAREFDKDCDRIFEAGQTEFKDFEDRTAAFAKVGGIQQTPRGPTMAPGYVSLIEAAQQTGQAHKILYELGGNLDEAARIMSLSPVKQAVEVAKLAAKLSQPAPISKAPAPISPIDAGVSKAEFDPETASLPDWMAWREKQVEAKRKRA